MFRYRSYVTPVYTQHPVIHITSRITDFPDADFISLENRKWSKHELQHRTRSVCWPCWPLFLLQLFFRQMMLQLLLQLPDELPLPWPQNVLELLHCVLFVLPSATTALEMCPVMIAEIVAA